MIGVVVSVLQCMNVLSFIYAARKHTGKRVQLLTSSASGKAKRVKLEESDSVKSEREFHVRTTEQKEGAKKMETESDNAEVVEADKMTHDDKEEVSECAKKTLVEEAQPMEVPTAHQQESMPEKVREQATPKKATVKKVHPFFCELL